MNEIITNYNIALFVRIVELKNQRKNIILKYVYKVHGRHLFNTHPMQSFFRKIRFIASVRRTRLSRSHQFQQTRGKQKGNHEQRVLFRKIRS